MNTTPGDLPVPRIVARPFNQGAHDMAVPGRGVTLEASNARKQGVARARAERQGRHSIKPEGKTNA